MKKANWQARLESEWKAHGLDCCTVVMAMGYRNGYVRIPRSHPWFALEYEDSVDGQRCPRTVDFHRIVPDFGGHWPYADEYRIESQLRVHGGITYSGQRPAPQATEGWWLGFDTAHICDARDPDLMSEQYRELALGMSGVVRDEEYVRLETENLAMQIAAFGYGTLGRRLRWAPRAIRGARPRTGKRVDEKLVLWGGYGVRSRQVGGLRDMRWSRLGMARP